MVAEQSLKHFIPIDCPPLNRVFFCIFKDLTNQFQLMKNQISRRDLLKKGALATAFLPLAGASIAKESLFTNTDQGQNLSGEPTMVKLNSNENPFGPSEKARQAIIDSISMGNRYPGNIMRKLTKAIAEKEGLTSKHVMITAGSSELLGLAGLAYGMKGGSLISSQPTFDFLLEYSTRVGANWIKVPLTREHQYNLDGIRQKVDDDTKLIFVCNPNNPTGVEIPNSDVKSFCHEMAPKHAVYLDEAYIELSSMGIKGSMVSLVDQYPNLMIARTFSKIYGLAGLRIGYLLAHPDTVKKLSGLHTGRRMTVSATSAAAALASLEDEAFFTKSRNMNELAREKVYRHFDQWGIEYLPSATSFIFFKTDKFEVDIRKALEKENVYIRDYSHVPGWARVSMGTLSEMDTFLEHTGNFVV